MSGPMSLSRVYAHARRLELEAIRHARKCGRPNHAARVAGMLERLQFLRDWAEHPEMTYADLLDYADEASEASE